MEKTLGTSMNLSILNEFHNSYESREMLRSSISVDDALDLGKKILITIDNVVR